MIEDQMDGMVEIWRAVPAPEDEDPISYWRVSRELAVRDVREQSAAGEPMFIQVAHVLVSHLDIDDNGAITTDASLIDWGAIERVAGLNEEELRAIEVLRDADIDPVVLAHIIYELARYATSRTD